MKLIRQIYTFFFYESERIGQHGEPFRMLKFRTMVHGADRIGPYSVAEDDPRITRVGRFLRKWKIDELPNLWNVLKGEMRLFGPRPEVRHYVDKMTEEERRIILSVRPGCIDLATLRNLNEGERLKGRADPEAYYEQVIWPEKKRLQIEWIRS